MGVIKERDSNREKEILGVLRQRERERFCAVRERYQ